MRDAHTGNWLQLLHNRTTWACSISHESPLNFTFNSREELVEHISYFHRKRFTAAGANLIQRFAEKSRIRIPRSSSICPICQVPVGELPGNQPKDAVEIPTERPSVDMALSVEAVKLSRHVAAHLKILAFKSLRGLVGDFGEGSDVLRSDKVSRGLARDDITELGSQADSDLENVSLSSYDVSPDHRILMLVQKDPVTTEDRLVPTDRDTEDSLGELISQVDLDSESANGNAPEWSFAERYFEEHDPILEHFKSYQLGSDSESETGRPEAQFSNAADRVLASLQKRESVETSPQTAFGSEDTVNKESSSEKSRKLIVGIDYGTTFSGKRFAPKSLN